MDTRTPARRVAKPTRRLGTRLIASHLPGLPPGTYTDAAQPGLQLRVSARAGGHTRSWLLRFKFRGEESRILLGHFPSMSLDGARGAAREFREQAANGIDPRRARPRRRERASGKALSAATADRHTIEFLVTEFMQRHIRPRRKRPEYIERILDKDVVPVWKGRDARTITPGEVIELLDGIVDRGAPVAANRTAALLAQMFKFAVHRRIVESSPVQLLYRPGGKEKPRERVLSDKDLAALLADPIEATRFARLAHVIVILAYTAQRRGELCGAKWSEIDFKAATWTIPPENSKTGRGHVVPLTAPTLKAFRALKNQAGRSRWVLPSTDPTQSLEAKLLTRGLARCRRRMKDKFGIEPFTLHDLRRTARTGLARLKVEPHIAERVLNHAQERIPGTYDLHSYFDEKREALEKWSAHLQGLNP